MIHLKNVYVNHPDLHWLHSAHVTLQPGISYLITGQNGSGKTTLLKLIAGKMQPQKGSITYDFMDDRLDWDEKFSLRKKHIHYVPAQALHELISTTDFFYQQRYYTIESTPLPTVRDYLGERLQHASHIQLPDSFQIQSLLDLELTRLSNGQIKKLIILKQLLDSIPSVLLLDYPFEGLDASSRKELRDFLDHLVSVHAIQLIIADQQHAQLPNAITKKIELTHTSALISDFVPDPYSVVAIPDTITASPHHETEVVVEMQEVKIQYGHTVITGPLTWKIHRGERWALTGRNGSGKTTLFSMIYADHPMAYSELVFLFGKRRGSGESIWDIKKRISYLGPEHLHFLDYHTGQQKVSEYLERMTTHANQLQWMMDYFQLHGCLSYSLRELSSGQLQLILLIALFLTQKELLLLDEPFQFLDPIQKERVCDYLQTHLNESVTLILITHYERDVAQWTNHRLAL